jgi:MFS transporter, DHA2 family, multidrug resistance protein
MQSPQESVLKADRVAYERRWKTLAVLSLALLVIGLDNTILNVALPNLQKAFGASTSTLEWIVDAYLLVFAGLLLTMGTLGDRFGRKRSLQLGLVLFGGGSLAVLGVGTAGQLIAVRTIMGLGGAMIMPATLSVISNVFPREERGKAIGIWSGFAAIGVGLGPLFGGLLLEFFDWQSVFVLNVPVALVTFALTFRYVPESRDPEPGTFDLPGAALSVAALGTLVYGIIEAPERGWTDPLTLAFFVAGAVFAAAFVKWELRTQEPMLNLSFLRNPRFAMASMAIGLASFALFGAIFALTQFLQDAHGYSALEAGAAMTPLAVGLVIGAGSSVKLVERLGTTRVVVAGLVGLAVLLVSALFWTYDMPYWPLGLWFFFGALHMGWIMGPATESVMGAVPPEKSGVASAMNDVTRQVGGSLGTAIVGSLITSLYASRVSESVASLPDSSRAAAQDSIGQAKAIAATLPTAQGADLAHAASVAFTDALGIGFAIAAGIAVLAAVAVKRWLPARHADAPAAQRTSSFEVQLLEIHHPIPSEVS